MTYSAVFRWKIYLWMCLSLIAHVQAAETKISHDHDEVAAHMCDNHTDRIEIVPPIAGGEDCGIWMALSTIPGAGLGMFAGKTFRKGDFMMQRNGRETGDHIIPIVDLYEHNKRDFWFLLREYTWNAADLGLDSLGFNEVELISPGFGGLANSMMDFVNVQEGPAIHGLPHDSWHRSKDPGAGAFSYHHSRASIATRSIYAGNELFVGYGDSWFEARPEMEQVPLKGDHTKAEMLLRRFQLKFSSDEKYRKLRIKGKRLEAVSEVIDQEEVTKPIDPSILRDALETFVMDDDVWKSRILAAFPPKADYESMSTVGILNHKRKNTLARSPEWLEKHGICADLLYMNVSTIPQAGHGAFASILLPRGTAILPVPLIHVPDRSVFTMRNPDEIVDNETNNFNQNRTFNSQQLILNYCLGHHESSMLLCPYGPGFPLINHNRSLANTRLRWAAPERSNHHPELLRRNISWIQNSLQSAVVAMELITLRDIRPGEEIILDYGEEWEEAWQSHVRQWRPIDGAHDYLSAVDLNSREHILRTQTEQLTDPYPTNVALKFDRAFRKQRVWEKILARDGNLTRMRETSTGKHCRCEILRRIKSNYNADNRLPGEYWIYTVSIPVSEASENDTMTIDAPREAFWFEDLPYTSDMFLPNAFRHDIRIPDDMFPESWKNNPPQHGDKSPLD